MPKGRNESLVLNYVALIRNQLKVVCFVYMDTVHTTLPETLFCMGAINTSLPKREVDLSQPYAEINSLVPPCLISSNSSAVQV